MNLVHPQAIGLGLIGIAFIVGGAGWYFLAPAGRRPKADTVRDVVRERMRPVMFADTLPAPRHELTMPAWAGPTRVAVVDRPERWARVSPTSVMMLRAGTPRAGTPAFADTVRRVLDDGYDAELEAAAARDNIKHGLTPDGHVSVESRYAALDAAGWTPGTNGNGLRPDVAAHVGDITTPGSLAALAATGPGSLLAPGVPAVNRADLTDDELDDARWAEEFRKLDARLAAESRRVTHWIAETFGPAVAIDALAMQQRDQARTRNARRQAVEWVTGEHRAPATSSGPGRVTPRQAKRARKNDNRLRGRVDRVLVEVGA
jgi:hypothetical protein